jgi:predicted O-linked N-acetylglucosamine transferase (SPINDLY family)
MGGYNPTAELFSGLQDVVLLIIAWIDDDDFIHRLRNAAERMGLERRLCFPTRAAGLLG